MPQGLMASGTAFESSGNTYQRIEQIEDYLFRLMEELRYAFSHIDPDNFTDNGLNDMERVITQKLRVRVEDEEKRLTQLLLMAKGLELSISDNEERLTQLELTTEGFALSVENGEESSFIKLMSGDAEISAKEIKFTGLTKFLTADDLGEEGETVIDGGRIKTGQITALTFDGCTFKTTLSEDGKVGGEIKTYYGDGLAGGIRLDDQGAGTNTEQKHRLFLYTNDVNGQAFALKLKSAAGCSIEAKKSVYIEAEEVITLSAKGGINLMGTVKVNGQTIGG